MKELELKSKNVLWNIIGATANAFTSLAFVMIVTFINGTDNAGIFSYGFATAVVLFCVANYITRPYQVTDISGRYSDSDYIYVRVATCLSATIAAILFCVVRQYDAYKSAIIILLCVYRITEAFIETFYAILQKRDLLYKAGFSMFVRAVLGVAAFFLFDMLTKNLVFASAMLVVVNVFCFFAYDLPNTRKCEVEKSKVSAKVVKCILRAGFFNFVLTALNSLIINISRYAIDEYETNVVQAIFGYIIMPATFMNLFGQYIVQPVLTTLSQGLKDKNYVLITGVIKKTTSILLIGGAIVFAVAYFVEVPVLSILFGLDFSPYKTEMMIIIFGSVLYALEVIISFILISFRNTAIQAAIFSATSVLSAVFSFVQVKTNGLLGAAATYALSMFVLALALAVVLVRQLLVYKKEWGVEEK